MRIREKDNGKPIIIAFMILLVIVIFFSIKLQNEKGKTTANMTEEEVDIAIENKVNQKKVNDLAGLNERDRMEQYVANFVKAINNEEYEDAYEMLYDGFKENYFSSLSSFEQYVKTKLPSKISLEYTNFERNGDIYVLWVNMSNPLASKDSAIEMNFVVQENDLNEYVLSFSVI